VVMVTRYLERYPVPSGAVVGLVVYLLARYFSEFTVATLALVLASGAYFGFGVQDSRPKSLFIESMVSLGFLWWCLGILEPTTAPIYLAPFSKRTLISFGWAAHGLVGLVHQGNNIPRSTTLIYTNIRAWYPIFSVTYSFVIAASIYFSISYV